MVTVRKLSRDKLAQFLPSAELIRAFEEQQRLIADDIPASIAQASANAATAAAAASAASEAAAQALEIGQFAADHIDKPQRTLSVRAGSGVTVSRDARGYVVSASGGLPVDDENTVIAGRFFGA